MHKLAVYGTLKRTNSNNYLLKDEKYIGSGETVSNYTLSGLMVFKDPATAPVVIDLYEVNEKTLTGPIDALEDNGSWYNREKIMVKLEDDSEHEAWLYFGLSKWKPARVDNNNLPKPNDKGRYNWGM